MAKKTGLGRTDPRTTGTFTSRNYRPVAFGQLGRQLPQPVGGFGVGGLLQPLGHPRLAELLVHRRQVRSGRQVARRAEIDAERISYGELAELQSLAPYIARDDVQLLEWAGVPEFPADDAA